jgi:hypothetical protein
LEVENLEHGSISQVSFALGPCVRDSPLVLPAAPSTPTEKKEALDSLLSLLYSPAGIDIFFKGMPVAHNFSSFSAHCVTLPFWCVWQFLEKLVFFSFFHENNQVLLHNLIVIL